jgi:rhamnose utilization protein RhaD (predicted bifunctional aldolase and dehydrogenase)/NAD(P)-dependent dehydrogenase (short-subunit alcohol dehydrogenase family)
MKSLWNEADARAAVARYADEGVASDLALRTYSARLLGADPRLVLHGGGNTSVKTSATDVHGEAVAVLRVKGSGWDLASIEPAGHPAVRLAPLLRLRDLPSLSDEEMVSAQRRNLMDANAPNPSVETLLHAFIPEIYIDHTHALPVLALANQPEAAGLIEEVYGDQVAIVPYARPGFDLAKAAVQAWEARPDVQGLILLNHGIFSFGPTCRDSYERMIGLVSRAEAYIAANGRPRAAAAKPDVSSAEILPVVRGVLAEAAGSRDATRWILDARRTGPARAVADDAALSEWAERGVATPDHVIRTKPGPLVLPAPCVDLAEWRSAALAAASAFVRRYKAYFERNAARYPGGKTRLDPLPRVIAVPGLGLIGLGRNAGEAAVAADIAESWAEALLAAESIGRFQPLDEADTFDMEYWSLEQAKLGKTAERRLERRVVAVTGGGGVIGAAVAKAFAAEGAQVALLDRDAEAAGKAARTIGKAALALACDITDRASVDEALRAVCERFGGLDVVVSNAGAAIAGAMADLPDADLRASFEVNFFGHQTVAQAAVRIMRAQRFGGVLLFNVSKQVLNPGPEFGAYGASKAALMALMRQYALEHGAEGIRSNAVNPDRIRSGLLTETMIAARAAARGLDPGAYMAGNLLGEEVTAEDVAQAFVFAALMQRTTGAVITVDGGNVAAMVR